MTQHDHVPGHADDTFNCLLATICDFLLPFLLVATAGNKEAARASVRKLIDAYDPRTVSELDLVGRILGFSIAAMDDLRLSMTEGLSDTKILRYRSNAATLSRAAEQARKILLAQQENRENTKPIPRPAVAAAPPPPAPVAKPAHPRGDTAAVPAFPSIDDSFPMGLDAMKGAARLMMDAFSKQGVQASSAIASIPDPAVLAKSATIANRPTVTTA